MNQTYRRIEIIVVDDNPCDYKNCSNVENFMNSIVSDQILYYKNEVNIGASLSRNKGIAYAHGSYITFLDDDDEYMPDKVLHQVEFMLKTGCDLSFSNMVMYNDKGKIVDFRDYSDIWSFDNHELLKYHLMKHLTGTPTFMFKTESLRQVGGFDNVKSGQEFYLMLKSIQNGLVIRYLNACDVIVHKHVDGGITQGRNKIEGEIALFAFKKKYFSILTKEQRNFIRFRHWAVMVVGYMRNHMYYRMLCAGVVAFIVSPLDFSREIPRFLRGIWLKNLNSGEV